MPASVAEFVKAVDGSGILTAASLADYVRDFGPETDATPLADRLVKDGRLTAFQARYIHGGKAKSLVLGPYVVLDVLGKGGMGYVYKAEHRKMRRVVALKVIARNALKSPAAVRRFEREVQAAARLEHPNIVTAHDAGEAGGTHYLVMQYVDGRNLAEVVKERGPQPVERAVDWVMQAARGLAFAHEQGVVHRDIKPGNLLVDSRGTVKVLDLGLARLETLDADQDQLTGTGQIMGTVDYMAPEQAMDTRQADARSDIYSLGVTLWYLLAGRPLFAGETAMSRMMSHMQTPAPSLTAVRGDFTPEIDAVFQRMVAKQPADRFQSMQEVVAALQSLPRSQTAAVPRNPEFRGARGAPEHPDMAATQTLEQPPAAVGDENTTPLIAVDGDTAKGPRKIPPETRRSGFRPKPVHLAIGGGAVAALVLIGLMIHTFGGGRDSKPRDGEATSSGPAAVQAAAPPDAVTSGAATEPQPAANPAARPDPRAAARQPAPRPSPPPAVAPFDAAQARKHQADWAEHLGIPVETVNSIGQTLVVIPPGKCTMGEGSETVEVTLTEPFLIGQTEVTQGQWTAVMGTAPWLGQLGATEGIDVPATNMTWEEAVQFCDTLTARDREGGRIGPAQVYRLPSEAESEFACRAGTTTAFSFGDDANQIGEYAWFGGGWDGRPIPGGNTSTAMHAHAVRQKRPNPWGLFDIHGNVFEWCFDWYADRANAPVSDPRGPASGVDRVIRGGSWLYPAHSSRSANRLGYEPSGTLSTVGFRVVMSPPGTAPRDAPASAK